eukprot:CAMPEP_0197647014 /NCGR_PEP_ID=MMETSP1338-20131121/23985_1 /TAXON_ID=43686 ORGANISM="Pelagodinium beii, Strain RCC1491" /NCGR_SAMPLE_ID=MMETSP1338 /ASSEMBLY_ACC=CAM_ASM_000754 /LENGTH=83 /DNA_ID=CAMNT_0043220711 /DNA_START=69 /DNA_END=320 /DNA_ORIENTATION=-
MKSAMLTILAALVFVALMLTGCTTDCESVSGGCVYVGISSECCEFMTTAAGDANACSSDADKAILEETGKQGGVCEPNEGFIR